MRDHLTFSLNGETQSVSGIAPATTLLNWLRREKRLVGTKQGCGEGDCGACTVVVGDLHNGRVRYRAVNACILFMAHLEGQIVLTVEHLRGDDGALHPVQQAMVEAHGSQCGFCTPGFVMSLYAAYLSEPKPSRARLNEILAGNLCRCTGYGPILAAGEAMCDLPVPAFDRERRALDAKTLAAMTHAETIELSDGTSRAFMPATVDALADVYAALPDATIVSGATDVGLWVTKQHRELPVLIMTNRVRDDVFTTVRCSPGLAFDPRASYSPDVIPAFIAATHVVPSSGVNGTGDKPGDDKGGVWIGAGVTHTEAVGAIELPPLTELWRRFAGAQVRNTGTVGGNIANGSPIGDLAPAFIALGATVVLRGGGDVRTVPLEDYFLAYGKQDRRPGEFILGVMLTPLLRADDFAIYKISKRFDDDISAVCGAFNIVIEGGRVVSARVAFGGMAATPKRALAVETALTGKPWTQATVGAARDAFEQDFRPISDMRASAAYRLTVAQNLLVRYFIERTEPQTATRLVGANAVFA
jgi:xanthine dehydrogenase small subunit